MWVPLSVSLCVCICVCLCSYKCARAGSQTHMPHSHAVDAARPCSSGSFDSSTTWSMLTVNCLRLLCVVAVAVAQPVCCAAPVAVRYHKQTFAAIWLMAATLLCNPGQVARLQISHCRWHIHWLSPTWGSNRNLYTSHRKAQPVLSKLFQNAIKIYWFYSNLIMPQQKI